MKKLFAAALTLAALVLCFGLPVHAQPADDNDSKVDIFGGFSILNNTYPTNSQCWGDICGSTTLLPGWHIQGTFNMTKHLGLTADVSGHTGSSFEKYTSGSYFETLAINQNFYTFAFGPSFTVQQGKMHLSAHTLAGASKAKLNATWNCNSECTPYNEPVVSNTGFAVVLGGSADYMFTPHWGWRIMQADYVYSVLQQCATYPTQSPSIGCRLGTHNIRISTGVIFRIGSK